MPKHISISPLSFLLSEALVVEMNGEGVQVLSIELVTSSGSPWLAEEEQGTGVDSCVFVILSEYTLVLSHLTMLPTVHVAPTDAVLVLTVPEIKTQFFFVIEEEE